uniref:Troponin I, fast skeletal muscle n=1 Tax=Capra hircus TaxID=9925 RepID=A0A452DPY4_CAPHI
QKRNRAITARRQHLKSIMLQIAATELEKEEGRREAEKQNYLSEHCPPLHLPGSMSEVQELCRQLHAKIDAAEEEKYDMEVRVQKSAKEARGPGRGLLAARPAAGGHEPEGQVQAAPAATRAHVGRRHAEGVHGPAGQPQERDLRDVGDWRKNIEEKSGMEGRKKMFETES